MSEAKTTTDHAQIKRWVEERGGHPARVKGTNEKGTSGVLLIDYPGYSGTQTLETLSWGNSFRVLKRTNWLFFIRMKARLATKLVSQN